VVSFRLALSNPTLPEITDGYEIQLHHILGHDHSKKSGNALVQVRGALRRMPTRSFDAITGHNGSQHQHAYAA
ncbi:hypothetical protein, partial [Shinella sp. BE166]|uniref:hypothetical protein n=1 Tax=Shinella sp. BE166 TaxID=3373918 RepID=UPI003EBA9247